MLPSSEKGGSVPSSKVTSPVSVSGALVATAEGWPDRRNLPSLRDIIAYRNILIDTSSTEIGCVAGFNFGWGDNLTVTAEQYVQGVVIGHAAVRFSRPVKSIDLIDVLVEDLTTARHDELHFDRIWNDALSVCLSCDIKGLNDGTKQTVSSSTKW